jgi:hypothetical protein
MKEKTVKQLRMEEERCKKFIDAGFLSEVAESYCSLTVYLLMDRVRRVLLEGKAKKKRRHIVNLPPWKIRRVIAEAFCGQSDSCKAFRNRAIEIAERLIGDVAIQKRRRERRKL